MANDKFTVVDTNIAEKATMIWNVADMLRGPFKPHEYGLVILPKPRTYRVYDKDGHVKRDENGKAIKKTIYPKLGEKAPHNGHVVYSLDFDVTPHMLRHTYITNLIHASVDPKTVQYLAGHESSKITMDIYAKVKYNRPDELVQTLGDAFALMNNVTED